MSTARHPLVRAAIQGFTLAEVIIVVTVLALLAGMTTPAIITFMQQRDLEQEELTLNEISKAVQAYLNDEGTLPASAVGDPNQPANWSQLLSTHSNMTPGQMAFDPWGRPRVFISGAVTQNLLNSRVLIWYATVHTSGPDRAANGGGITAPIAASGIPVNTGTNPDDFAAVTDSGWWNVLGTGSTPNTILFSRLTALGDDKVMKFTDFNDKLNRYNLTLERLNKISVALETYAKSSYGERVLACSGVPTPASCTNPTPEQQVYYPRSSNGGSAALYASTRGETDLAAYTGGSGISNSSGAPAVTYARFESMVNLMRILGLPDSFCCSALETFTFGGQVQEVPFFYSSNPRPRASATTCGARPGVTARKLPARMTTTNTAEGAATPPSCL